MQSAFHNKSTRLPGSRRKSVVCRRTNPDTAPRQPNLHLSVPCSQVREVAAVTLRGRSNVGAVDGIVDDGVQVPRP
eukprot:scaffold3499_cov247-Pinguiococcus_pyrenoidosus.AAC.1